MSRYAADGTDLESVNPRIAELARGRTDGWVPDHPPTVATWEPRRLWVEMDGGLTWNELQSLLPEEVAAQLDFLQIANDRRLWQHGQQRPDG